MPSSELTAPTPVLSSLWLPSMDTVRHVIDQSMRKLELVWHIAENLTDGFTIARLLPFLEDFSDDVRWAVMDIIESLRQKGRVFDEAFLTMLSSILGKSVTGEDASTRIASRAAELLFAFETPNAELSQARLRGDIDTSYFFDKKGYPRRRKV